MPQIRADLDIIKRWIKPGSSVLDLGCGDGTLLKELSAQMDVQGYGLEIEAENITRCIQSGVNVIQYDLNDGLKDFNADAFDYVIMTQALQAINRPDLLLKEMLRVGRQGIVTFPNFGNWSARLQLALGGHMPVTRNLPNEWYNTPNIHLCTLKDFEALCKDKNIRILQRCVVNYAHRSTVATRFLPGLLGEIALYRFERLG